MILKYSWIHFMNSIAINLIFLLDKIECKIVGSYIGMTRVFSKIEFEWFEKLGYSRIYFYKLVLLVGKFSAVKNIFKLNTTLVLDPVLSDMRLSMPLKITP